MSEGRKDRTESMEKRAGRERAMEEDGQESVRNDRKENDLKETTGNNGEEEETRRLIYRGWKVMPFIIGKQPLAHIDFKLPSLSFVYSNSKLRMRYCFLLLLL